MLITAALLDRQTASQQALIEKQTESQAALLEKQSQVEVDRERGAKVFEEKLRSYDAFLSVLEAATRDGRVDANEVRPLVFQFGRLKMHTRVQNVEAIASHVAELVTHLHGDGDAETKNIYLQQKVLKIVGVFHDELSPDEPLADAGSAAAKVQQEAETRIGEYIQGLGQRDAVPAEEEASAASISAATTIEAQNARWTGKAERLWYANTGGGDWEEMRRHGFWSCGGGELWYQMSRKLQPGDEFCAYFSGMGYVALGIVPGPARPLDVLYAEQKWQVRPGSRVEEDLAKNPDLDPVYKEWAAPVIWTATAAPGTAWRMDGMFASPMTLCRLRNPRTIAMLQSRVPHAPG